MVNSAEWRYPSPLRYPGGKGKVANYIKVLISQNSLSGIDYIEPYAGGASVALSLLFEEYVGRITINDINPGIHAFWKVAIDQTDELCRRIQDTPLSIDEWRRQRAIYRDADASELERGFATFYLNRTNRSGIIASGGVIGGLEQRGRWKIDARFERQSLCRRISKIARFASRISISSHDAAELISRDLADSAKALYFLDPPYYVKGSELYDNFYQPVDHSQIRDLVATMQNPWLVSYDAAPRIVELYSRFRSVQYTLSYSASSAKSGTEVMFFSDDLSIPDLPSPASVSSKVAHSNKQTALFG